MTSGDRSGPNPSRRAVVLGGAAVLAGSAVSAGLAGCTGSATPPDPTPSPSPPSPDALAAGRAALAARALLAAESALAGLPRLTAVIAGVAASHRAHLTALGLPDAAPPSGSPSGPAAGSPSGPAAGSPSATSTSPVISPATAVSRERAAASEALADVTSTTPETAGLLARIAAARAVHADLLAAAAGWPSPGELPAPSTVTATGSSSPSSGPSTSASTSPSTSTSTSPSASPSASSTRTPLDGGTAAAISALLAGEHAVVFAYGLITARAAPAREALARQLWEAHRARRDELERRLVAAGRATVAAEPAYDVGRPPTTPAQLSALAARVEEGLAAVALRAVTDTAGAARVEVAGDLVRAARRAAAWRGTVVPLPGALT